MIVPMKKATIICETGDAESTVKYLRTLGVLHVEHQNIPAGSDITDLKESVALISSSIDVIDSVMVSGVEAHDQERIAGDWTEVSGRLIDLAKQQDQREALSRTILGQIREWENWGDIDQEQVENLKKHGVFLCLLEIPVKETGNFTQDVVVKTLFTTGDIAHCVAISRSEYDYPYPEVLPPKKGITALKIELSETHDSLDAIRKEILDNARFHQDLNGIKKKIENEIEFREVLRGMGREGEFMYVTGYIPADSEEPLLSEARSRKWGIQIADPSDVDVVPTLIRNPRWVSLISPVLSLLGLTPGYRELDTSAIFLVFFSIFFGILIGDAGYGLAYIVITVMLQKSVLRGMIEKTPEMKTTITLFYILGGCALVWGFLTGTFFGQSWFISLGYVPPVPQLNDPGFMQSFCFFLGALHLSIAHSWNAAIKYPSLTLFADIGWICVLWTAFFLARTLILGVPFPGYGIWLIVSGVLLVICFTHPQRNVLKGIGTGLGTLALSLVNNFTDVISYIRLFAVGLATLAIAETTNTLAFGFGDGIVGLIAGVVILITGHGLNIILGPMSVLVHGVRLNVLEFSGHANVIWSGTAYEPFKEE